jgi:hypothetical protein
MPTITQVKRAGAATLLPEKSRACGNRARVAGQSRRADTRPLTTTPPISARVAEILARLTKRMPSRAPRIDTPQMTKG